MVLWLGKIPNKRLGDDRRQTPIDKCKKGRYQLLLQSNHERWLSCGMSTKSELLVEESQPKTGRQLNEEIGLVG